MDTIRKSVSLSADMDRRIVELRKKEQFERCSLSEIIRLMIEKGLEQEANSEAKPN